MKNILIIAYYYPPYAGVASKRPSYWHESFLEKGYNSLVITATEQVNADRSIVYVAPESKRNLLIKDEGSRWFAPLKRYFAEYDQPIDVAIITGGPFLHFPIAALLKRRFGCKVILDFRDPFAVNPRFNNSRFKILIKSLYERRFLSLADHVITVNEYCSRLLVKNSANVAVINNGFDERAVNSAEPVSLDHDKIHFVYAGKFAFDRNPSNFLEAIKGFEKDVLFHFIGPESEFDHQFESVANFVHHGVRSYKETISILKSCDYGMIFTSGSQFESTTKIFDYIACGLGTVIVTEQQKETGSLHDLTRDLDSLFWLSNSAGEITSFLKEITRKKARSTGTGGDIYKYSRKAGFDLLLDLVERKDG